MIRKHCGAHVATDDVSQFDVLVPLWLLAPTMLRICVWADFVEATSAFRWLLVAAVAWSASSIVIRTGSRALAIPE